MKVQGEKTNTKAKICEENHGEVRIKEYTYATIYLKHGKAQKSRPDMTNAAIATSRLICYHQNIEEGK